MNYHHHHHQCCFSYLVSEQINQCQQCSEPPNVMCGFFFDGEYSNREGNYCPPCWNPEYCTRISTPTTTTFEDAVLKNPAYIVDPISTDYSVDPKNCSGSPDCFLNEYAPYSLDGHVTYLPNANKLLEQLLANVQQMKDILSDIAETVIRQVEETPTN